MTFTVTVYERLPFGDYLDLDAVSSTGLKDMLVSPLLYSWRRENGRPDKDAMRVGRATHTNILEPHRFEAEYAIYTGAVRRGKEWEAFKLAHADRTILTETQNETAIQVAAAVRAHPIACALLEEEGGKPELSITWTHERTKLACKSRIDWLCSSLVDIKTCRDPSPRIFGAAAARLNYPLQMAFYSAALASAGVAAPAKIIAAQNVEPFDVVVYAVTDETLMIGERLYEIALDRIVACKASGAWDGQAATEVLPLKLPLWARPDYDETDDDWSVTVGEGGV